MNGKDRDSIPDSFRAVSYSVENKFLYHLTSIFGEAAEGKIIA